MRKIPVRHKGVMLPKGVPVSGQTNASNPTSLGKLRESYVAMVAAQNTPLKALPSQPSKMMPQIDKKFTTMGELLGICPYELRALMAAEVGEDQTLVLALLKKFVTAAKLSGVVDLTTTHQMIRNSEDLYRKRMDEWQKISSKTNLDNAAIQRQKLQKEKEFRNSWCNVLIDLQTKLERNSDLRSLGEWDRLMVMAIASIDDKFCKISKNSAVMDFTACRKMKADDIASLTDRVSRIKAEEEQAAWCDWINKASVDALIKRLWEWGDETSHEDSQRRVDVEQAIIAKSGKEPRFDRWGNLDWNRTFNEDQYTYEYTWDEVDTKRHLKEEFCREIVRRVKSGSGKAF